MVLNALLRYSICLYPILYALCYGHLLGSHNYLILALFHIFLWVDEFFSKLLLHLICLSNIRWFWYVSFFNNLILTKIFRVLMIWIFFLSLILLWTTFLFIFTRVVTIAVSLLVQWSRFCFKSILFLQGDFDVGVLLLEEPTTKIRQHQLHQG